MSSCYSGGEVLFIATQIEQNGAASYRKLAERNPALADVFLGLAADEDEHFRIFGKLQQEAGAAALLYDDEATQAYLNRLAGDFVFPADADPMAPFAAATTRDEVLDVAMELEKRSITLYEGMAKAMSRPAERELINRIIDEEQKHIAVLTHAKGAK